MGISRAQRPRRWARIVVALGMLLAVAGCQTTAAPSAMPPADRKAFRVAMLLPRAVNADGWTRSGYQGLLLIQRELGAEIAYAENVPEADYERVFRRYAADGYDFIIGHGNQFIPAAEKVAADFPRTDFAVAGKYGGNNTNLGGLSLREGEMGYLFGVIAALQTRSHRVAYLGGAQNASGQEITTMYVRGVQAVDPAVQVRIDWVGTFTDTVRARQLAQAQIASGVDVIFVLAGAAGEPVHALAEQAGAFTLGWVEDVSALAPRAVLTSNVQNVPKMLLAGATLARQGRWEGKSYKFGLAEGAQDLAPFHGLMSAAALQRIAAVKNDILAGAIDTTP